MNKISVLCRSAFSSVLLLNSLQDIKIVTFRESVNIVTDGTPPYHNIHIWIISPFQTIVQT